MKKLEKYLMLFSTLIFLGIGYYGFLYGTGENVNTGMIYCGFFGLVTWSNYSWLMRNGNLITKGK